MLTVIGDGSYDTQPVHAAVIERNATLTIPPRKNARMRKGDAFAHRNTATAACRRFRRKLWKNWSGYHRRNLVETKMHCIKRRGERVMPHTFDRPVNELHIRASPNWAAPRRWLRHSHAWGWEVFPRTDLCNSTLQVVSFAVPCVTSKNPYLQKLVQSLSLSNCSQRMCSESTNQSAGTSKYALLQQGELVLQKNNQVTVSTLREGLESFGAGEIADVAIAAYVIKRLKDAADTSSKEQAAAELADLSRELKADKKTAEFAKIVDFMLLGMALSKN